MSSNDRETARRKLIPSPQGSPDDLLTPRQVAEIFGVRTATIGVWAREGQIEFLLTPGGHRRYRRTHVRALFERRKNGGATPENEADRQRDEDAVRLYAQGWSIKQVGEKFDMNYSAMRRLLLRNGVKLRQNGARAKDF